MSYVNAQDTSESPDSDLENQVDRVICFVDTSQTFPSPPCHFPMGSWTKGHSDRNGVLHGSEMWTSTPQGLSDLQLLLSTHSASSRDQLDFSAWHSLWGWSASYLLVGWLHWTLPFVLTGVDHLGVDRSSRHTTLLPKQPSVNWSTIVVIHTALFLNKELPSQQMKCNSRPTLWISLVYSCSSAPRSSWIDRTVAWHFENSVSVNFPR